MTPTDTDRFLARVKQRAEDGCGFAAEDMLRVLSVVEGLSRELLEAKAHRPAQAAAAANLTSLVGLVREVMADTGAEWLSVVSDDGQMLSRWSARPFLADLESLLGAVGAPLVAASGASSAEGSIPSLPCPSPLSSPTPPAPEAAPVPDLSSGATGSEGDHGLMWWEGRGLTRCPRCLIGFVGVP